MTQTALITGASAGLGTEFAHLFAADGHDVVLVARRHDRLETLAKSLAEKHRVKAHVLAVDLAQHDASARIASELEKKGIVVDFLVNNAGFGLTGALADNPLARELEMIDVNVRALVELTRLFLPGMLARKRGRILNMGSTAGFQPGPFMAGYYASKAYVSSFSEAVAFETRDTGVTVTVSCPGPIATEFGAVAGNDKSLLFASGVARASDIAKQAYRAMHAGKTMVVHGARFRFLIWLQRFAPRRLVTRITARLNAKA